MNYKRPCKDINELEANFKKKAIAFLKEVWWVVKITETYRSQKRQNYLYSFWRTLKYKWVRNEKKKRVKVKIKKVTWTKNSNHTWRNAFDICFKSKKAYPKSLKKWKSIWDKSKKYWIDWGYNLWKTDKPHFQCDGTLYNNNNTMKFKNNYFDIAKNENIKYIFNDVRKAIENWDNWDFELQLKWLIEIWLERKVKPLKKEIERLSEIIDRYDSYFRRNNII